MAATVLICFVVVLDSASTWSTWHAYGVIEDYVTGDAGVTDVNAADQTDLLIGIAYLLGLVASGIVFVTWLWRARENAESCCPAPHRRGRGWVVGSWICPVVNLWFPLMVVDDVHRASRPGSAPDLSDLRSVPGSRLLGLWWACWLTSLVLDRIVSTTWRNAETLDSLRMVRVAATVESVATVGAAVAIVVIVRQISAWQDGRA